MCFAHPSIGATNHPPSPLAPKKRRKKKKRKTTVSVSFTGCVLCDRPNSGPDRDSSGSFTILRRRLALWEALLSS